MNWLTLFAFSAAGASGALDDSRGTKVPPPVPAIVQAAPETQTPAPTPEPALDGVVLKRASGGFLQVKMEGMHMVIRFYDDKKLAVKPDVERAIVRVIPAGRSPEQLVLALSPDGSSLKVAKPLRQPHVFKMNISLVRGSGGEAVETFSAQYP